MFKIIHTNDIHSHLENWPGIKQFITQRTATYQASQTPFLLMDIGDAIDAYHPMIEATQGRIMIELFNEVAYDCVTIGNNEGINIPPEHLAALYEEGTFDVTIANLLDGNYHQTPNYAKPYLEYEIDNKKIIVFGLTAPYPTYHYNHYHILSPVETLRPLLKEIKKQKPDFIILLSHLGLNEDRYLAQVFPQIDLILGGHTHHLLPEGEWVNQTLLTGCGRYGQYIGEVTVDYNQMTNQWDIYAETFAIKSRPDPYIAIGENRLAEQLLPMFSHPLRSDVLIGQQSFVQFALETIQTFASADVAVLNNGLFLSDLSPEQTNAFELQKALPHPMHLAKLTMTGEELRNILEQFQTKRDALIDRPIKGLGFRGEFFGELMVKDAYYDREYEQWYVNGSALNSTAQYTLVTVDHLLFLPFFTYLQDIDERELLFPELLREVIARGLESIERN
ncbi:bifunctional metallophosphatase/5'-nucleotidase [Aerococcaceae bacterium DSM 111020]|nr:bifunctional metallophosphatase/5'-nucleotidase [Aerococcaceae bacterium DSM 111020]